MQRKFVAFYALVCGCTMSNPAFDDRGGGGTFGETGDTAESATEGQDATGGDGDGDPGDGDGDPGDGDGDPGDGDGDGDPGDGDPGDGDGDPSTCTEPLLECEMGCVDPNSDPQNCGECGASCSENEVCQFGDCACGPDALQCDGDCIDPLSNPDHCGECGNQCTEGLECVAGSCVG